MVRRRVASEKRSMAVGLRQCIRPLVESLTPGHDGYPLAFVLINWTASKRPFPISGFESVGETHCHLYFPPADLAGTRFFPMYGPPQSCKRKMINGSWSAPMYSALNGVSDSGP